MMPWDGMMIMMNLHSMGRSVSCVLSMAMSCMIGAPVLEHWDSILGQAYCVNEDMM